MISIFQKKVQSFLSYLFKFYPIVREHELTRKISYFQVCNVITIPKTLNSLTRTINFDLVLADDVNDFEDTTLSQDELSLINHILENGVYPPSWRCTRTLSSYIYKMKKLLTTLKSEIRYFEVHICICT